MGIWGMKFKRGSKVRVIEGVCFFKMFYGWWVLEIAKI